MRAYMRLYGYEAQTKVLIAPFEKEDSEFADALSKYLSARIERIYNETSCIGDLRHHTQETTEN